MSLKESMKGYMEGFGGKTGNGKIMQLFLNSKK